MEAINISRHENESNVTDSLHIEQQTVALQYDDVTANEIDCTSNFNESRLQEPYCAAIWDSFYCWPPTPGDSTVSRPCSVIFASFDVGFHGPHTKEDGEAFRICSSDGQWLRGNWTNYTQCLELLPNHKDMASGHMAVSYIMFVCSFISLITLTITLGIFCYFQSLQCSRLRVHRNLVVSLMVHSVLLIILPSTVIFQTSLASYRDVEWLCKLLMCVKMYAAMASINWMFVEGQLLHSRIAVSVFKQDAPFKLYYFIGWGLPLVFVSSWASVMSRELSTPCWEGYGESDYVWILTGPMVTALLVNSVFLVNIIRILVTKLRRSVSIETTQVRKAVKATALLFPLLGITHLMFCVNPKDDAMFEEAYMITNAVLQSSQGFFVAVLYCFMNSEVQTVVRNSYLRAVIRHNPNYKYGRSRSLPRTSTAFLSHTEISIADTARHKVVPYRKTLMPLKDSPNGRQNDVVKPESDRQYAF